MAIISRSYPNNAKTLTGGKDIANYYGVHISYAKNLVIRILYGAHYATGVSPDVLIRMRGLFVEIRNAVEKLKKDSLFASIMELHNGLWGERPEYSAPSIFLGGMEYECTSGMEKSLEGRGCELSSLVHDGVYFACPDSCCISEDFKTLRGEISEACGVDVSAQDLSGEKVDIGNRSKPT